MRWRFHPGTQPRSCRTRRLRRPAIQSGGARIYGGSPSRRNRTEGLAAQRPQGPSKRVRLHPGHRRRGGEAEDRPAGLPGREGTEGGMKMNTQPVELPRRSVVVTMATKYGMEAAAFEATLRATVVPKNASAPASRRVSRGRGTRIDLTRSTCEIYAFPTRDGGIEPIVSNRRPVLRLGSALGMRRHRTRSTISTATARWHSIT